MDIKVIQKIDESYFKEFYSEWLQFRSVFKKWEDKIGLLSILLAMVIYFVDRELKFVSVGLVVFGILMIFEFYSSKRRWMKSRLESKINNEFVTIIFQDNQIQIIGPLIEMKGEWNYFKQAVKTRKGIFFIPENGISIYIQNESFQNQSDVEELVEKIGNCC